MQTLTSIRRRGWSGRIASLPLSGVSGSKAVIVRPIWTNEGSIKRVIPLKEVPFGGLNDVSLNFGGKILLKLKFGGVNMTFKPEREKIQILIT